MSFAGKLGRGLLQGMAGYYGKVAEQQEFDRRAAALDARERALARFRTEEAKDLATHQGGITRQNTREELKVRGELEAQDDQRALFAESLKRKLDNEEWTRRNRTEFGQKMTELGQRHRYAISEAQLDNALAIGRDAAAAGVEIDEYFIGDDGAVVGVTKDGQQRRVGAGLTPVRRGSGDDDDEPQLPNRPGRGSGGAQPAAAPAAAEDYSQFNQLLAEAAMHPRFKGKSAAQIRAEVLALARRNQIPAPAR